MLKWSERLRGRLEAIGMWMGYIGMILAAAALVFGFIGALVTDDWLRFVSVVMFASGTGLFTHLRRR